MNFEVNKEYVKQKYDEMFIDDPIFAMALGAFLDSPDTRMPAEMYGRLISDCCLDPEKLIARTEKKYDISLEELDNGLQVNLWRDGKRIAYGKSYVQGDTELDFVQAISYAAHMVYKIVQQRVIK